MQKYILYQFHEGKEQIRCILKEKNIKIKQCKEVVLIVGIS